MNQNAGGKDLIGVLLAVVGVFIVWLWATGRASTVWTALQSGTATGTQAVSNVQQAAPSTAASAQYQWAGYTTPQYINTNGGEGVTNGGYSMTPPQIAAFVQPGTEAPSILPSQSTSNPLSPIWSEVTNPSGTPGANLPAYMFDPGWYTYPANGSSSSPASNGFSFAEPIPGYPQDLGTTPWLFV